MSEKNNLKIIILFRDFLKEINVLFACSFFFFLGGGGGGINCNSLRTDQAEASPKIVAF